MFYTATVSNGHSLGMVYEDKALFATHSMCGFAFDGLGALLTMAEDTIWTFGLEIGTVEINTTIHMFLCLTWVHDERKVSQVELESGCDCSKN